MTSMVGMRKGQKQAEGNRETRKEFAQRGLKGSRELARGKDRKSPFERAALEPEQLSGCQRDVQLSGDLERYLAACRTQESSAANRPPQSMFRSFLAQYPDIGMGNRQKLSSLGPIFAIDDLSPTGC